MLSSFPRVDACTLPCNNWVRVPHPSSNRTDLLPDQLGAVGEAGCHRALRCWAHSLLALVPLLVPACHSGGGGYRGLLSSALEDGRTVKALIGTTARTVVLVYEPSDCVACGTPVGVWLEWGRHSQTPVLLLLTRRPTALEAKQLQLARIAPAGVVKIESGAPATPSGYLVSNGVVQDSALGRASFQPFLSRVTARKRDPGT